MARPRRFAAVAGTTLLLAACATPTHDRDNARDTARFAYREGEISLNLRGEECLVTLTGEINPATVASLTLATNDLAKRNCRSKWLILDATDGQVGAAITIGSMLRNRAFNTRLQPGSTCATSCLLVFAAGAEREIPAGTPRARIVFTPIPPDEDFGKDNCDAGLDNRQVLNLGRYLRAMVPGPTAGFILQKIRTADCRGVHELPANEAVSAGLATKG